ncbi:LysR family transcriptional regulator [Bordetella genomosp. 10]|nr:LysR family transcriptional regulator [Bordetella genomosp. 10]
MKHYTMAQMEAFLAIAECGSFRIAAERLGITQPSISLRIRDLESALGCTLFVRGKGGVRLSEAGQIAQQYVQRGFDVLQEMERRLSSGDPLTGSLRLGSSNTFALSCLPALLAELERRHPTLRVELTITNSAALRQQLDAQKLDIAFLVDAPSDPLHVVEPLALCEIAWFSRPAPSGAARTLRASDLRERRIVTMPPASPFHIIIGEWFARAKVPLPTLDICNDMATLVRLVRLGVAASVLPVCLVEQDLSLGGIVRHKTVPALTPLVIYAAHRAKARGRAARVIIDIARDVVANAGPYVTPITPVAAAPAGAPAAS